MPHLLFWVMALGVLAFAPGWAQVESWSISSVLTSKPVIDHLASQLGSKDFSTRQRATEMLKKIGRLALPRMRVAQRDPDLEVQMRANLVKQVIFRDSANRLEFPPSTLEYGLELLQDMKATSLALDGPWTQKQQESYEQLIQRSDQYVKGDMDADEISYRYEDLTRRLNESSPSIPTEQDLEAQREILWFLKKAPVVSRLGLASLLAHSESAQDRQKGIGYLLQALRIAPDIAVSQVDMLNSSFLSIARELKAADDPEFARTLAKAQGGPTALEALQTYFK